MTKPSVRGSRRFRAVQQLLSYQPQEEILGKAMAYAAITDVGGDYLEFGVYGGSSFATAYHFAQLHDLAKMRFYAFDSFEGMPAPRGLDSEGYQHTRGTFDCDVDTFRKFISGNGVDTARVEVVAGWYDDVLNDDLRQRLPIESAAIVSADCGLYESTSSVLNFVVDYVVDGTVLIFGDWHSFRSDPQRGQQRAFSEWLAAQTSITATEFHTFGWHGTSFILHRSDTLAS